MKTKKASINSKKNPRKINPEWFTGKVNMNDLSASLRSPSHNIYHVKFEGGARTKLHFHSGDQILYVTGGRGSLQMFSKTGARKENFKIKRTQTVPLATGDMVFIPRGILHTHGSTSKRQVFSHIAFNIIPAKQTKYATVWYESDFASNASSIIR